MALAVLIGFTVLTLVAGVVTSNAALVDLSILCTVLAGGALVVYSRRRGMARRRP